MTQPNAKLVEVARAIAEAVGSMPAFPDDEYKGVTWDEETNEERDTSLNEWMENTWIHAAWPELLRRASEVATRAAIRALMEPSEDMVDAGSIALNWQGVDNVEPDDAPAAYRAMLAKVLEEEG